MYDNEETSHAAVKGNFHAYSTQCTMSKMEHEQANKILLVSIVMQVGLQEKGKEQLAKTKYILFRDCLKKGETPQMDRTEFKHI